MFFRKMLFAFGFICLCHFDNSSSYAEQTIASAASLPAPRVHLKFDGDLQNAGTQPRLAPRMFTSDGRISRQVPNFVDGTDGQALRFAGGRSVDIPLDVFLGAFPKITFTAWIYAEPDFGNGAGHIVSNNSYLSIYYYAGQLWMTTDRAHTIRFTSLETVQPEEWVFVAGVWNATDGTATLFVNGESKSAAFNPPNDLSPDRSVWLGAQHANKSTIRDMRMDDVRIYDTDLTLDQLNALYTGLTSQAQPIRNSEDQSKDGLEGTLAKEGAPKGVLGDNPLSGADPETRDFEAPEDLPGDELKETVKEARSATATYDDVDKIKCEARSDPGNRATALIRGAFPNEFSAAIKTIAKCGRIFSVASVNEKNQWIVAMGPSARLRQEGQIAHSTNIPGRLARRLRAIENRNGELTAADIAENGSWLIVSDQGIEHSGVATTTITRLNAIIQSGKTITNFDFAPGDAARWVAVDSSGGVDGAKLPETMIAEIELFPLSQRRIRDARFGTGDRWIMAGSDLWYATSGMDQVALQRLRGLQTSGRSPSLTVLGSTPGDYIVVPVGAGRRPNDPIWQFENTVSTSGIRSRMAAHNIAALSVAMIRDNKIAWARGYGLGNPGDPESYVRPNTTFEAASLSKPLAAFGFMQLVDRESIDLDEEGGLEALDSLFPPMRRVIFRDAVLPHAGTIAQVMQHCASICYETAAQCANNGGGGGAGRYAVDAELPTVDEMILGLGDAKASHKLVRTGNPNVESEYSSANYMLVQALFDVYGDGFTSHMDQLMSDLGMQDSTFATPYPKRDDRNFARGWNGSDVTPIFARPEKAAASLVSTPTDYAKFVIAMNRQGNGHVPSRLVERMLGKSPPATNSCNKPGTMGLGVNWEANQDNWDTEAFFHGGLNIGYRARMVGLPQKQSGIVVFMTGTLSDANALYREIRRSVRNAYDDL